MRGAFLRASSLTSESACSKSGQRERVFVCSALKFPLVEVPKDLASERRRMLSRARITWLNVTGVPRRPLVQRGSNFPPRRFANLAFSQYLSPRPLSASAIEKSPLLPGRSSGSQEKALTSQGP